MPTYVYYTTNNITYLNRVLNTGPIALWPQNEVSGTVSDELVLDGSQDGAYTSVTLNDSTFLTGDPVPSFDGANSLNDIYTATFAGRFNPSAGGAMVWAKVSGAGVWTDGNIRQGITLRATYQNRIHITKMHVNNQFAFRYEANATVDEVLSTALGGNTGWMQLVITWDTAAGASGEVKAFANGSQVGSTQTGLGTWAGSLNSSYTTIGALSTTVSQVWDGWIGPVAVWDRAPTPTEVSNLYSWANP